MMAVLAMSLRRHNQHRSRAHHSHIPTAANCQPQRIGFSLVHSVRNRDGTALGHNATLHFVACDLASGDFRVPGTYSNRAGK